MAGRLCGASLALVIMGGAVFVAPPVASDLSPCYYPEECLPRCDWVADDEFIYCTYGAGGVLTIYVPSVDEGDIESFARMYPECASDVLTPTVREIYNLTNPAPSDVPQECAPRPYVEGYQTDRDGNFRQGAAACDGDICYYIERGHATGTNANAPYDLVCVPGTTTPGVAPFVASACLGKGYLEPGAIPYPVNPGECETVGLSQGAYIVNRVTGARYPGGGTAYDLKTIAVSNGGVCS